MTPGEELKRWLSTTKKLFPYKGEQLTLAEIAKREQVSLFAIYGRWKRARRTERLPALLVEYNGEMRRLKSVAEAEGVTESSIASRIKRGGSTKTQRQRGLRCPKFEYNGEMLIASEIARREGVSRQAIQQRIAANGKPARALEEKGRICSRCKGVGHYVRTCGQQREAKAPKVAKLPKPEKASKSARKPITCGICGKSGHRDVTCWRVNLHPWVAGDGLGMESTLPLDSGERAPTSCP